LALLIKGTRIATRRICTARFGARKPRAGDQDRQWMNSAGLVKVDHERSSWCTSITQSVWFPRNLIAGLSRDGKSSYGYRCSLWLLLHYSSRVCCAYSMSRDDAQLTRTAIGRGLGDDAELLVVQSDFLMNRDVCRVPRSFFALTRQLETHVGCQTLSQASRIPLVMNTWFT